MKKEVASILKKSLKSISVSLSESEIENMIEIPPQEEMGDFAFPCFFLSKKLKRNPNEIALELNDNIKSKSFERTTVVGGYINFFLDKNIFTKSKIKKILKEKEKFGKKNIGKGKRVMIEFSQANTHKAFHVGHIRGTSIGESLSRIDEFFGRKVIRANYQGDTGMHVSKWIWCYEKYHSKEKLRGDESWIASIYVDAIKKLAKNEKLQKEVNEINKKLESREDKKLNIIWKKTRKLSLDSLEKIYKELNTKFDVYYFESEAEQRGKEISKELVKKKIAIISDDATIMNLEKYNLGIWVLLRSDGTVLYSAKDLALAEKKFKDFKLDNAFYVIANEQELHMNQLSKSLELMGKENLSEKIRHISYNIVRLPKGKMSSRTGDNVLYSDFMKEIKNHTMKEIKNREKKISNAELENRALKISVAAIKYSMLKQDPKKVIVFNKEDALNFEGNTGTYLLYSYARASSILKKSKIKNRKNNFKIKGVSNEEFILAKKLSEFPEIVLNAYNSRNPSEIANYSYQLAQVFNEFYHKTKVIDSENEIFLLKLVDSFRIVLKSSLNLLGIEIVERM
ncbi:arginine--tRNA ligase [Candidatus Pacearchaeota archaeon CG10_big_fil_rev_8_21_14_0_10_34_12]|nr:MAG: arginine--tRNA ligase [Candidatus Pacearchaeota archaeon CG10_big_fil_rev_8_21_14_0_10_34_12]